MEFHGPAGTDLENVTALNERYLELRRRQPGDPLAGLGQAARQRLAASPFLLFSLREHEAARWERLLADGVQLELHGSNADGQAADRELRVAAVSVLWQLARRNPFAARLVTGAPPAWCARLAATMLVSLITRVSDARDLLTPRFPDTDPIWLRLLEATGSPDRDRQRAVRIAALQDILTRGATPDRARLAAAACRMRPPSATLRSP